MSLRRALSLFLVCLLPASARGIIGGLPLPDAKAGIYRSVVRIHRGGETGGCTGTFVNETTVLTAAHCLVYEHGRIERPSVFIGKVQAVYQLAHSNVVFPTDGTSNDDSLPHDLGIVVFPEKTASQHGITQFPAFASSAPNEKDEVILVGFSPYLNLDQTRKGATERRWGWAPTRKLEGGIVFTEGRAEITQDPPTGKSVRVAGGDSGGPLFLKSGRWVGVASAGGAFYDRFVFLQSDSSTSFLGKILDCRNHPCRGKG